MNEKNEPLSQETIEKEGEESSKENFIKMLKKNNKFKEIYLLVGDETILNEIKSNKNAKSDQNLKNNIDFWDNNFFNNASVINDKKFNLTKSNFSFRTKMDSLLNKIHSLTNSKKKKKKFPVKKYHKTPIIDKKIEFEPVSFKSIYKQPYQKSNSFFVLKKKKNGYDGNNVEKWINKERAEQKTNFYIDRKNEIQNLLSFTKGKNSVGILDFQTRKEKKTPFSYTCDYYSSELSRFSNLLHQCGKKNPNKNNCRLIVKKRKPTCFF